MLSFIFSYNFEYALRFCLGFSILILLIYKIRTYGLNYFYNAFTFTIFLSFIFYIIQEFLGFGLYLRPRNDILVFLTHDNRFLNISRLALSFPVKSGFIFYASMFFYFFISLVENKNKSVFVLSFISLLLSLFLTICTQSTNIFLIFTFILFLCINNVIMKPKVSFPKLILQIFNLKNINILFWFPVFIVPLLYLLLTKNEILDFASVFHIMDLYSDLSTSFIKLFIFNILGSGLGYVAYSGEYSYISDLNYLFLLLLELGPILFSLFLVFLFYIVNFNILILVFIFFVSFSINHHSDLFLYSFTYIFFHYNFSKHVNYKF